MVAGALAIAKVRCTSGAGLKLPSPLCEAVSAHVPAAVRVTVAPETVQAPVGVRTTGSPEEAVALSANGASPKVFSGSGSNVIVWSARATVRLLEPVLPANWVSPAKLAPIPAWYVPAGMPARGTAGRVATPLASVVALP